MDNKNLSDFIGQLTDFIKSEAKTETVVGQPFQLGEFTCVPVIGIGFGVGGGGGEASSTKQESGVGAGGGAGMGMGPLGFLVTHKDQIQFIPTRQSQGLSAVFEKLPDMLGKYFDKKENASAAASAK